MDKYVLKYRKIIDELIKKSFPELNGKGVLISEFNSNKGYSATSSYWVFSIWIIAYPKTRGFSKSSLRGVLAHELSHMALIINMNLFEKIKFLSWLWSKNVKAKFERDAEFLAVKRGYGEDLIQLKREAWKGYSKQELKTCYAKGYLSINEIKQSMKHANNTRN